MIHPPDELAALERGLVLAGYLVAGEPAALVPIFIRPERWPERREIVLQLNGRPLVPPPAAAPA